MFVLAIEEFTNLRSQFVTSRWGGIRYSSMAFTEQGVAMLSSILRSKRAKEINILIKESESIDFDLKVSLAVTLLPPYNSIHFLT